MSGATDSGMVKTMGIVMAALLVFAVICAVAARILSGGSDDPDDYLMRQVLTERLKPVASVRTSVDDLPAASQGAMTVAAADSPKSAEDLVNGACAACHVAGVANAPKLGDEAAWAERREAGLDALVASVINGKGSMPARGGSTYSDDEIRLAVQHIALFEVEETSTAPATQSGESDAVQNEAEEETAQVEDSASDTESAAADSESATGDAAPVEDVTESASDDETVATETAQAESDSSGVAASTLVVGQVPDGLSDNIKVQVDGVCAGCHISGVANAPKIGDTQAWQLRADKGLDALTQSVVNGLNAMPPRGGSTLTDDEIPVAVQYLMSK